MNNQAHVRDKRQPGHFWADNEIVEDYLPTIGVYGFAVYMLLCKYANSETGQCDPSVKTIAKTLSISAPTVQKALKALVDSHLITVEYRPRADRDRKVNDTNIYTLLAVAKKPRGTQPDWVPNDIGYGVPNHIDQGTQGDLPGVPKEVLTNNTHKNKTHRTRESGGEQESASPARTPAVQAYFQTFNGQSLNAPQVEAINRTVTDLPRWQKVLDEWMLNGWGPRSIGKMLDRYTSGLTMADQRPSGSSSKPAERPAPTTYAPPSRSIPASELATPEDIARVMRAGRPSVRRPGEA